MQHRLGPDQGSFTFEPIGTIRTVYREKFGIPRQSGLAQGAWGVIELVNHDFYRLATEKLEEFSHLWIVFVFHRHDAKQWKPRIRPPRLGGSKKVGVLASRSPHRPNPIGLSVVKIERIERAQGEVTRIHVSGVDILDGTPVLDIKPYIPYADLVPDATGGWASAGISRVEVEWSEPALVDLAARSHELKLPDLKTIALQTLELDPRPASQRRRMPVGSAEAEGTRYGFMLEGCDVRWEIRGNRFVVLEVPYLGPALETARSNPQE